MSCLLAASFVGSAALRCVAALPEDAWGVLENHCLDCHDSFEKKGGLDIESLGFDLGDHRVFERWVMIFDRAKSGEMPPKKKRRPSDAELERLLEGIGKPMLAADRERIETHGRSSVRRLNRFEYENTLRELLKAPWLQVADRLPEDGVAHLFNKVGDNLDVSHVNMSRYLDTAEYAVRTAMSAAAFPSKTEKFYAREEPTMLNYLGYRFGQRSATRSATPLLGVMTQPDVIRGIEPVTVGETDPERREREAFGFVSGTYTATTKYDFTRMDPPIDGRYKIRLKSYTYRAGNYGASGGDDHGLTGGNAAWWRPSRTVAYPGDRSEPITLYALADSGDSRWLATYDALPEPTVIEKTVDLKRGEGIRPDAGRLVRTRPGWKGNPNASEKGIPGFALNWLEVEGPLHEQWPPESYQSLFGELPFEVTESDRVVVLSEDEEGDARRFLGAFAERAFHREVKGEQIV
ncbi:MAG: DUF1587 domain-containing protein, partial [Verrucomicrobiota bacterium]